MSRDLPVSLLHRLLRYEPETGKLFWRERTPDLFAAAKYSSERACAAFNAKLAGKEAFTAISHGYRVGRIFDVMYPAHRVIWAMQTGEWPVGDIDHVDGDRQNNEWLNLRDVTHAENGQNMRRPTNNRSGCTGVSWNRKSGRWEAYIGDGRDRESLGYHVRLEDAISARKAAERRRGYHPNHDRIAA